MFRGRVAIVTGAGAGLGLAYAKALASHGCQLVINDIGCVVHDNVAGENNDNHHHQENKKYVASVACDEINALYGGNGGNGSGNGSGNGNGNGNGSMLAIPNHSPVSMHHAHEIVQCALDRYGRVDYLINNAGIVRDHTLENTSDDDWDMLCQVHLSGVFQLSKLVYRQFRRQMQHDDEHSSSKTTTTTTTTRSGDDKQEQQQHHHHQYKILFISSVAIHGSMGQVPYSAMKSALIGMCHSLNEEIRVKHHGRMKRENNKKSSNHAAASQASQASQASLLPPPPPPPIRAHVIMPLADTRILRTSHLPEHVYGMLHPDAITNGIVHVLLSPSSSGRDSSDASSSSPTDQYDILEMAGGHVYGVRVMRTEQPIAFIAPATSTTSNTTTTTASTTTTPTTTTTSGTTPHPLIHPWNDDHSVKHHPPKFISFQSSTEAVTHLLTNIATLRAPSVVEPQQRYVPYLSHMHWDIIRQEFSYLLFLSSGMCLWLIIALALSIPLSHLHLVWYLMKNSKQQQQQQEQQQQLRDTMSTATTTTTTTTVKNDHTKSDKNDDDALSSLFQLIQSNLQSMDSESDSGDSSSKLPKNTFMYKLSNNKRFVLDMAQRSLRRLEDNEKSSDDDDQMADVVIEMRDEDFMDMMHGKAQPTQLFFAKKLKIRGNLQLAMKMMTLRERLTRPASSSSSPSIQSKL